ncbi:hypothetical protein E4U30_007267 [Claviceps sp. LM220 group G6]|nr:hypothetical protein E4U30_007267 [Claviceps sp. LM220 group G6]
MAKFVPATAALRRPAKAKLFEVRSKLVAEVNVTDPDYSCFFDLWDTVNAVAAGNGINIGRPKGSGGKLK